MIGRCACGEVAFEVATPSKFCAHCHCRWCRAAHGAAFVTWVGFYREQLELTRGADTLCWVALSPESERGFCGACGTTMLYRSSACPGEIHLTAACIDGELDRAPAAHVFVDHRAAWSELPDDGLPRLESDHPLLAAYSDIGDD